MEVNLKKSQDTALKFIRAEINVSRLGAHASEKVVQDAKARLLEAMGALENDPLAQQLLVSAREYDKLRKERSDTIRNNTLLGSLVSALDFIAHDEGEFKKDQFKDTVADEDWNALCTFMGTFDEGIQKNFTCVLWGLFDSTISNLNNVDLPPVPKFTT